MNKFESALQNCAFGDWTFRVGFDGASGIQGPWLQVRASDVCNVTGDDIAWGGRKWRLSWHMTTTEIVQTAFKAVMTAMEHETRERFKYKGVSVFDPHMDVDALVGFRVDVALDARPGGPEAA